MKAVDGGGDQVSDSMRDSVSESVSVRFNAARTAYANGFTMRTPSIT